MLQFENIFFAVDNFESKLGCDFCHVAGPQPSICPYSLFAKFLHFVISSKHLMSAGTDLTPWSRSALAVLVFRGIFHLWDVSEPQFDSSLIYKIYTEI